MWKFRPPWPSFMRVLILLVIILQVLTPITHQHNHIPRGQTTNDQRTDDTNKDVDKLNDHPSRLTTVRRDVTEATSKKASSDKTNDEQTAITLPLIKNDKTTSIIDASIRDRNHHHHQHHQHRRRINNNHVRDKRRKRKKVHEKSLQQHTINNKDNSTSSSINSHNKKNRIKPKSNSIKSANKDENDDDLVELIDEIDELEFSNGTISHENIRRKKDGYYVRQPNGVVMYRKYKCVPKTEHQNLVRPSTTYSSQYYSPHWNQRRRKEGM